MDLVSEEDGVSGDSRIPSSSLISGGSAEEVLTGGARVIVSLLMNRSSELDLGFAPASYLSSWGSSSSSHEASDVEVQGSEVTQVWLLSIACSCLIGCTGLLPFLVLPPSFSACESLISCPTDV